MQKSDDNKIKCLSLEDILAATQEIMSDPELEGNVRVQSYLKMVLRYCSQALSEDDLLMGIYTHADGLFVHKLIGYIENNIHRPDLTVNDLCREMGVTYAMLNKKLKLLMSTTPNNLIRSVRLNRAEMLLRTGLYSVTDVTFDVGFSDLRYFRECFKEKFGFLPQECKHGEK